MATNPVLVYVDAKKRFDTAHDVLMTAARNADSLARDLMNNWRRVMAPGIPIAPAMLSNLSLNLNFNKANWPTGDQLFAMLLECHQAFNALENAYRALSGPDQRALSPSGPPQP
jgi:hypothetical protein